MYDTRFPCNQCSYMVSKESFNGLMSITLIHVLRIFLNYMYINIFCLHVLIFLHHNNAFIYSLFDATFSLHDLCHFWLIVCLCVLILDYIMILDIMYWWFIKYKTLTLYMPIVCLPEKRCPNVTSYAETRLRGFCHIHCVMYSKKCTVFHNKNT